MHLELSVHDPEPTVPQPTVPQPDIPQSDVPRPAGPLPVIAGSAGPGPVLAGPAITESVLTATGSIDAADVPPLRLRLLEVLDRDRCDVLLDLRGATTVDDLLMGALTAVRSRAKYLRHRLVVIDDADGAATAALRREGMQFRIPIYLDPASAVAGLRADRAARARLTLREVTGPSAVPASEPLSAQL